MHLLSDATQMEQAAKFRSQEDQQGQEPHAMSKCLSCLNALGPSARGSSETECCQTGFLECSYRKLIHR